jgi:hypothetical protein
MGHARREDNDRGQLDEGAEQVRHASCFVIAVCWGAESDVVVSFRFILDHSTVFGPGRSKPCVWMMVIRRLVASDL